MQRSGLTIGDIKLILITGMPRSGTSFMGHVFGSHGQFMKPPLYTTVGFNPTFAFNLMEPSRIATLCAMKGSTSQDFLAGIADMKSHWKYVDNEKVIKVPQLSFFPDVCGEFSKIIVCVREVDEKYLKSAIGHNMAGWLMAKPYFLESLKDRTLEGLAKLWKKKAEELSHYNKDRTYFYRFGDKSSFDAVLKNFTNDQSVIDDAWEKNWRGSRF